MMICFSKDASSLIFSNLEMLPPLIRLQPPDLIPRGLSSVEIVLFIQHFWPYSSLSYMTVI